MTIQNKTIKDKTKQRNTTQRNATQPYFNVRNTDDDKHNGREQKDRHNLRDTTR